MKYFNEYGAITPETEMALDGIINEEWLRYVLSHADNLVETRALGAYFALTVTNITNEVILYQQMQLRRKERENANTD